MNKVPWCVFLLIMSATLGNTPIAAQSGNNSSGGSTGSNASSQSTQPATPQQSAFNGPLADYVPCMFRAEDEYSMRARPADRGLNARSSDQLFNAVMISINTTLNKYKTGGAQNEFVDRVMAYMKDPNHGVFSTWLIGDTTEQARLAIQKTLFEAIVAATPPPELKRPKANILAARQEAAAKIAAKVGESIAQNKSSTESWEQISKGAIESIAIEFNPEYVTQVETGLETVRSRLMSAGTQADWPNIARRAAIEAPADPAPTQDATSILDELRQSLYDAGKEATNQTQQSLGTFQPPPDISCSMAIMSWKETRDVFGRRVANTFIGIQVNLRNLNTKNEFLVHDIQVAVDTGIDADHFGRFQSGRDKLLVRAVAQKGQSDDRRNIVANVLQTVGSIAAASSLVAGTQELKDAVAVFQGAFIPGFQNIFPDHTVDHLNHISDLVFSASNTNKVVVPIQGSVPLVTFISEKPLEELPYAWCGHEKHKRFDFTNLGREQNCDFNGGGHDPGYVTPYRYHGRRQEPEKNAQPPASEPALTEQEKEQLNEAQQQATLNGMKEQYDKDKKDALKFVNPPFYPQGPTVAQPKDSNYNDAAYKDGLPPWKDLAFRDWAGAAVRMLQEHAYVVISGVHIQEVVTQPRLSNLNCPQFKSGQMDLSQTNNGNVECTVSGVGLNLVTGATLQQATKTLKSSTFKPSNDGNSATIAFKPEDLCAGDGDYSLFVTYKSDTQKDASPLDSGSKVQMTPQPVLTDKPTLASGTLTLKGACLDTMKAVTLKGTGNPTVSLKDATDSNKSRTGSVVAASGSKLSGDYTITYSTKLVDLISPSPAVTVTQGADASNANNVAAPAGTPTPAAAQNNATGAKAARKTRK